MAASLMAQIKHMEHIEGMVQNYCNYLILYKKLQIRDETIRSSHEIIRIDTTGDDMVIFDTIRYR